MKTQCPSCRKTLTVPEAAVGRKGKCPACGMVFVVQAPVDETPPIELVPESPPIQREKGVGHRSIDERIVKLENDLAIAKSSSRWLMVGVVAMAFVGVIVMVVGLVWLLALSGNKAPTTEVQATQKVLRAHEFDLVDVNGKTRAFLRVLKDKSTLMLMDETDKIRLILAVGSDTSFLKMYDGNDKCRIGVDCSPGPGLCMFDENGQLRSGLSDQNLIVSKSLIVRDENGNGVWHAP